MSCAGPANICHRKTQGHSGVPELGRDVAARRLAAGDIVTIQGRATYDINWGVVLPTGQIQTPDGVRRNPAHLSISRLEPYEARQVLNNVAPELYCPAQEAAAWNSVPPAEYMRRLGAFRDYAQRQGNTFQAAQEPGNIQELKATIAQMKQSARGPARFIADWKPQWGGRGGGYVCAEVHMQALAGAANKAGLAIEYVNRGTDLNYIRLIPHEVTQTRSTQ